MKGIVGILMICIVFTLQAFAQDGMAKDSMMMSKVVTPEEAAKKALKTGDTMPEFSLSDAMGKTIASNDLLKQGNLVVVFYRGAWCPFCNKYLHDLQAKLTEIRANGGNLIAISVENPDSSMKLSDKQKLSFTVLSDPKLMLARQFGIVYELPKETNEKYIGFGVDLVKANGTAKPELPLSATYIVGNGGKIIHAFLEPDYRKRMEASEIIKILSEQKAMTTKTKGDMPKRN